MDPAIYASHLLTVTGYPLGDTSKNNQKVGIMLIAVAQHSLLIHWQISGI
jgi:hypothetical protein